MSGKDTNETEQNGCCPGDSSRQTCCPPGESDTFGGNAPGGFRSEKMFVFVIMLLAAVGVGGYYLLQNPSPTDKQATEIARSPCAMAVNSIKALKDRAAGKKAVFILLPGENEKLAQAASQQVEAYVSKLSEQGKKVAAFTLQKNAEGFEAVAKQFSVKSFPSIVVWGPGGQWSTLTDDFTETKLLRAFVKATTPVSSGCCPKK